jgi:DNA-directed RNA polymerase specialized sigma24 family protein
MSDTWPDAEALDALFRRVRDGDPVARSEFIAATLDPLVAHLCGWRREADEHACISAAEDALLNLLKKPEAYDAAKRTLAGYLRMSAEGDLLNGLEKERRHHRNRDYDSVELAADGRNDSQDGADSGLPSFSDADLAAEIASFNAAERTVFDLMRDGEKATAAFTAALGIAHLSKEDQAREVKRVKDRVIKRLQRVRSGS